MPLPKTILVPTDFGEPSEAALTYALDFAKAVGAEIVLLHAYEIPVVGFPDGVLTATGDLTPQILEGARIGLDRQLAGRVDAGVTIRPIVRQGEAFALVNEVAKEIGADLIVMGTHGRTGIPRALLGSVAEKVVRTASVPVLTIHAGEEEAPTTRNPARESDVGERTVRSVANGIPASQR